MAAPVPLTYSGPAPFVDAGTVARLLTPRTALAAVQEFFVRHSRDRVFIPPRIHLSVPSAAGDTIGLYMPAATAEYIGVKLAHLMPRRTPNVEAEMFFYDAGTGRLLFWGDGKPLTALRTAAMSAAAALRLVPECNRLVVFGSGVQAAAHIAAFVDAYPNLQGITVLARTPAALDRLRGWLAPELTRRITTGDPVQALPRADCVVTTTPAPHPIFDAALLPARCHVAAIGSAAPGMNELAPDVLRSARVWVDTHDALRESGDCAAALAAGWRETDVMGDAFDLLGAGPFAPGTGRTLFQGLVFKGATYHRTVFKTVGHASQDLALLLALWNALQAEGLLRNPR